MTHFRNAELKLKAVKLRELGYSYSEVQKFIPVSHATLSRWLRSVVLTTEQKKRLVSKLSHSALIAKIKNRERRIEKTKKIELEAQSEIKKVGKEELLLIGAALYWAEGAKQKEHDVSTGIYFSNSDPSMIKIFLLFVEKVLGIAKNSIILEIYIHESHNSFEAKSRIINYWANVTGFERSKFDKIYFKKHKLSGNRKNKGELYFGLLRIRVRKSTDLNRKISGWIKGISKKCGIV